MSIKYISKNKDGIWKMSTTKVGKPVKSFAHPKEAITYALSFKNTDSILIKGERGWTELSGWDEHDSYGTRKIANSVLMKKTNSKTTTVKKPASKTVVTKKPKAKKVKVEKPKKVKKEKAKKLKDKKHKYDKQKVKTIYIEKPVTKTVYVEKPVVVEKIVEKIVEKPVVKTVVVKKPGKTVVVKKPAKIARIRNSRIKWPLLFLFILAAISAGFVIYWFLYR